MSKYSLISRYFLLLERNPIQVKVFSACIIFSSADILSQLYEVNENKELKKMIIKKDFIIKDFEWDNKRTIRMAVFGVLATTWLHFAWTYLDIFVEKYIVSACNHHYKNALCKVFIDQSCGAPIFNIMFFGSQSLLQGNSSKETVAIIEKRLPDQLRLHYCFWPIIHTFNFSFVSFHKRVLVQNFLTIFWMSFLSYKHKHLDSNKTD